ncbi:arylesterase [Sphingomonas bacterium]|uniref:arylesterase n=1 Tax=Sphingomonas bacterium TaxID=1895847 RepID=UPI0015758166|nr:arylesterase [Sphingomonas bacterium]
MTANPRQPGPRILALGDSLTAGFGLAPRESFVRQLEALLVDRHGSATVHQAGVSGDTSADAVRRLPRVLAGLGVKPDLAIVELGANDLIQGVPPDRMRASLDAILIELGRCGIPVLVAGMRAPAWLGAFAARFDAVFPALASAHGASLYPFFLDGVVGDPALTLMDGLHPNARAIAIVVARMLPFVEAALARGRSGGD